MELDIKVVNLEKARESLKQAKAYCEKIAGKKTIYSVHINNCLFQSTRREDVEEFIQQHAPKSANVKEQTYVNLEQVNTLRKQMSLAKVCEKLNLNISTNSLKVMLMNAGYIKTNKQKMQEMEKRNKRIRSLYNRGYTPEMIVEELNLDLAASTVNRIVKGWQ